jgi:hypothetical protein
MFLVESVENPTMGSVGTLAEILYEAEVSYGNIVRRMMTIEHKAVVTEDIDLLNEGAGAYFETFKEWVKKWFAKIKAFFGHMWDRITELFTTDEKWIAEFKKKSFGDCEVSVSSLVASGKAIENLKHIEGKLVNVKPGSWMNTRIDSNGIVAQAKDAVISHLEIGKAESISEGVKDFIFGTDTEKTKITNAGSFVAHFEALLSLGKGVKGLRKSLDSAESECNKAASKAEGDARKAVEFQKAAAMNLSNALSAYSSALGTARSQIKTILFAGAKQNRKDEVTRMHGESALFAGVL